MPVVVSEVGAEAQPRGATRALKGVLVSTAKDVNDWWSTFVGSLAIAGVVVVHCDGIYTKSFSKGSFVFCLLFLLVVSLLYHDPHDPPLHFSTLR